MNKINIEEMKRYLKRSLKKKIKITTSLIVLFMMGNSIGMASYITLDNGKIGTWGRDNTSRGSIALNPRTENDSAVQHQVVKDYSIAIGVGAEANNSDSVSIGHDSKGNAVNSVSIGRKAEVNSNENEAIAIGFQAKVMQSDKTGANGEAGSIAIGKNARTWLIKSTAIGIDSEVVSLKTFDKASPNGGGQGLAVGSGSKAVDQATSLGNDTFAIGRSSIAIGSDDNDRFQENITKEDFNHYFKKLFKVIDSTGSGYGYDENARLVAPNKRRYSPTLAAGEGGIALGTRALSYGIGATSIGAFSYALGDYSTAMGAKTRAEGDGAIAIGNETKVFSNNSVAVGNKNEVSEEGGMAYGYNAISSGNNTIAIGSNVYGNVNIKTDVNKGVHKQYNDSNNDNFTVSTIDTDFEDKNLEKTLGKLETLYKDSLSYTTGDLVDKKLEFNGKEESTGKKVKPSSGNNAIVVGTDSVAKGENSITFGHAAFGMKDNTVSIGSYTYVNGKNSLGLGIASRVFSDNSLSIGVGSVITHNANSSLVFGNSSVVKAKNSLAIGNYSKAELENSISIGNHSNTDYNPEWLEEPGYAPKGAISTLTSKGIGVVSIGTIGKERRLTNLASGYRDTDAVNVSQLRSLEEKLSTVNPDEEDTTMINYLSVDKKNTGGEGYKAKEIAMKEVYYKEYIKLKAKALEIEVRKERNDEHFKTEYTDKITNRINELEKKGIKAINDAKKNDYGQYTDGYIKDKTKTVDTILKEISKSKDKALVKKQNEILNADEIAKVKKSNYNNDGATGADSIALGYGANANGSQAIAIGKDAEGNGSQSVVIGTPNSNNNNAVTDNNDNATDTNKDVTKITAGTSSVSIGNGVKSGNYSVGIGGNVVSGDTAVAIGDRARAIGKFGIAIGEKAKVEKENGIAFGNIATSTDKNAIAIGNSSKATKENAIALGQGAKSEQNDSVAIGNGSEAKSSTDKAYLTDDTNNGGRTFAVGGTNIKRRITGVADGSADSDAVTVAQLKKLSEKGITFKDDKDTKTTVGLAGEIKISGKEENNHRNISVTTNNKNLEVTLSKTLKGITSIENGNNSAKLTLNNDNITVNNKKLTGLADGSDDTDAVAYGQIKKPFKVVADNNANGVDHNLGKKIEITGRKSINDGTSEAWSVNGNNNPKNGRYTTENVETFVSTSGEGTKVLVGLREDPTFKKITLKDGDTKQVELTPTTDSLTLNSKKISGLSNGTNDTDAVAYGQVKNPFKVVADNNATGVDHNLGKKIEITGRKSINDGTSEAWSVNGNNNPKKGRYTTENVETFVSTSGEGTRVLVGLREDPTFKEVELANSGKNVKFGIDDKGNATLTDARNTTASPIVTENSLGDQKISYAANSENKKETTLTKGFNFSDGTNTKAEVGDNGVVKFNLKDKLTGITSITNGNENNVNENSKIELKNDKLILTNKGKSVKILTKVTNGNEETLIEFERPVKNETSSGKPIINPKHEDYGIGTINYLKDRRASKDNDYGTGTNIGRAATEGAVKEVKDYVAKEITKVNDTVSSSKLKLSDGKQKNPTTKDLNIKDETLELVDGTNTTVTLTKDDANKKATFKVDVKGDLTGITSIAKENGSKLTLNENDITVNNKKLTGLADGDISDSSTDAITGKQLKAKETALKSEIAKKADATDLSGYAKVDGSNVNTLDDAKKKAWATGIGATSISDTTKDQLVTGSAVKTYVDGRVLKFAGNTGDESEVSLGNKLSIVGEGDTTIGETATNNITIASDKTNKKLTVKLAKDLQNIGSVTFKQGDKTTKINIDDSGDLNITKNGDTNNTEKILTTNNIGNQEISYKSNLDNVSKKTKLTTGFNFTSDDLEIKTENDGKVTFNLTDKVKNSLNGKGNDGRDGKSGTDGAGSKGLTGKDGLNGKDLTTKVNALRNGEAGTVVYTDKDGNRLVKANNGDYYKAGDVEDNGNAKQGKQKVTEIKATLVNPDGSTTTPTTVLRVADGSIAKDSKDAINGGQLNNLGYMLGLEVNGKNTGFKAPKIADLKGTNTTPANILDGLNQTREQINKGLTFEANYNADGYGASSLNRIFGETLSITASGAENGKYVGKDNSNYTGDNLATYVKQGKFYIGMKETPTFKSINIGSTGFGDYQTDKGKGDITADNEGLKLSYDNASVTIAKDGDKAKLSGLKDANIDENTYGTEGVAATQKEVKDVLNKINANGTEQAKLKNGTLGTLVYTDKDGNKLMKDTDGKFYKAQADGTKEENAKEVVSEDVILSTVKPDGKTTEPITLGNVASALGLSKDKKDKNNEILNKLVNKKAEEVYKDAELNKVVTLRDLQFLASKGITFAGSVGTANKYLGDTITINESNSTGLTKDNFATKYETKNIAVKVDNNTGNIEVGLAKELKAIESIENKETKVTLTENGTEFKTGDDGVTTKIGKDGIEITKQGGQNPSVSIKAGDTTNGPSIDFATTSADNKTVGTGSITGLKDLDDKSDGHMAANKNYVDEKVKTITGDIEKLKNKGLKFAGNTGETKELNDKVNIKGEGTETNNFESAKGNINVVANDSGVELKLAANLKNMKSFEAKDDKGNTVNITGDKIEFKKNNKSTLTINSDGTITGLKTNSSPFEYYEKNKDTVFAKDGTEYKAGTIVTEDGKVYAKGTQEVEGKYFAEGDKVVKAKDGKFYKEKDIKDRTYDEATKKWSGDSAQPTEATEAKALEGNELKNAKAEDKVVVKGKDNKFYEASDFEKAEYDEAKNEYTKDGKKLEGKEAKDVVIKALPNNEAMTLSNIANARLVKDSKDAVNAGQMLEELDKKMNKDGSNIDKKEFANNISEGANITKPEGILVTDKQVNEHLNKNYYNKTEVDAKVSNISNTVVEANKKSDLALGGVANAVAMANLLQANSYSKYKTNISAAYGYYGGSNALAIGFSGVSENRMVSYRVSGSVNTKGNIALGAGLGVMLGEFKTDKYPEKGKKISELEEKLRLQTEKTNKLEKQLEEILKLLKK